MDKISNRWRSQIEAREATGTFRQQRQPDRRVDFYSNDYLGLARSAEFQEKLAELAQTMPHALTGPSASRVLYGHNSVVASAEEFIAANHNVANCLLVNSGYNANLALLSAIAQRGDTILIDELVHRSVHDACTLSVATKWKFRHQDLGHLETLLNKANGNSIVVVESLYSMDGDFTAIPRVFALCQQYGAGLIVDEAHAVGLFPRGLVHQYGLQNDVLATVITYGKAFGLHGAAILGSKLLCDYLINFSSPLIYTTGFNAFNAVGIREAYQYMEKNPALRNTLCRNIAHYLSRLSVVDSVQHSPIQPVKFPHIQLLHTAVRGIEKLGLAVYPIFPPTVEKGTERLRICLHAFNTVGEINELCKEINKWKQ
ncbi:aminotransferase class I/II-fold pyridoxal phosphate-dependent enzyme [Sphingobacterium deserti]|uniref:8-amino-7-oxononanoate synthase n=1 Tax=Sphingobacterium deserti TaxID=1229276 RepID=A0A0B8TC19_9SPHI|nr:pyridoxal phosphate-dependent aminotransferase family protein [Sphingobacterium deserti]KGE15840.1 8-amino-7-oxononanoate synthase [Sphingobacterium deserti]